MFIYILNHTRDLLLIFITVNVIGSNPPFLAERTHIVNSTLDFSLIHTPVFKFSYHRVSLSGYTRYRNFLSFIRESIRFVLILPPVTPLFSHSSSVIDHIPTTLPFPVWYVLGHPIVKKKTLKIKLYLPFHDLVKFVSRQTVV